jgi:hypothetical protein
MKAVARSHIWWPNIDQDIEKMAKACMACSQVKSTPPNIPLHPWVWPDKPWRRIHVDFAGPLFNRMYLLVVDAHSKWPIIQEMKSTTTEKTVKVLQNLFCCYGIPEQLVTDNGPQFIADQFASFMRRQGIRHFRSAPFHPATNGAVERLVKTFKQRMKIGKLEGENSKVTLQNFLQSYRATPHSTTGTSPAELFLKRRIRTRWDLIKPDQKAIVEEKQGKQKENHDRRAKCRQFVVHQRVMVRDYRKGHPNWSQGVIQEVLGSHSYLVQLQDGTMAKRHADQVQLLFQQQSSTVPEANEEVNKRKNIEFGGENTEFEYDDIVVELRNRNTNAGLEIMMGDNGELEGRDTPGEHERELTTAGVRSNMNTADSVSSNADVADIAEEQQPTSIVNPRRYLSRNHRPPDRPFMITS